MTSVAPPHKLGRYRVLRRLAQGGMAELFLAEAADLPDVRRTVVIKRLLPELARDDRMCESFLNEARIMASLNHPNVIQVLEVFRRADELFIAMEHVEGENVGALLEAKPTLALEEALPIVCGVLEGLDYVHDRRDAEGKPMHLVHRDITLGNVIVTYDGAIKLIDFGIARRANQISMTSAGMVRGTVPYMSPEQARGLHLDRRSDLFSVAILLYELTVGQPLYVGESQFDILKQIIEGAPPHVASVVPDYPPILEDVLLRGLQKSPADRYQTAGEMLAAVEGVASTLGLPLSTTPLKATMRTLFASSIRAWQELQSPEGKRRAAAIETLTAAGSLAFEATKPAPRRNRVPAIAAAALVGSAAVLLLAQRFSRQQPLVTPPPAVVAVQPHVAQPDAAIDVPVAVVPDAPIHAAQPKPAHRTKHEVAASTPGQLVLETRPWCDVTIDGVAVGPTPVLRSLPPGIHKVHLHNGEFDIDRTLTLGIPPGRTVRKRLDFPAAGK